MKIKIFPIVFLSLLLLFGCNEDLLDIKNPEGYNEETFFTTTDQLTQGMMATYATLLHRGMHARDWYFIFDLTSSDAMKNTFLLGDDAEFYNFSYNNGHTLIEAMWISLFRMRTRATIIYAKANEFVAKSPAEEEIRTKIMGEALFMKSYAYYRLVQLWGDVPYADSWDEIQDQNTLSKPRTPKAEIFQHIEEDLAEAVTLLPESWDNANKGRATKYAAIALLGKVFLEQQKYNEALAEFKKIEDSGKFKMWENTEGFSKQFSSANNDSPETIFDVRHNWYGWGQGNAYYMFGGAETWGGKAGHTGRAMEYGFNDWWNVFISKGTVQAFKYSINGHEYVDPRAKLTFYGDPAFGGDTDFKGGNYDFRARGDNWKKYSRYETQEKEGEPTSDINTQIIRYADVLLMMAECYFFTDRPEQGIQYINKVRARVGAEAYTAAPATFADAFKILKLERRLELSGEQVRWFDMKRWHFADKSKGIFNMVDEINADRAKDTKNNPGTMTEKFIYFPIPIKEVQNNKNLVVGSWAENWN